MPRLWTRQVLHYVLFFGIQSLNGVQCPTCPYGGLDLSRGLFEFFASEGDVIYGSWSFVGEGSPPKQTTTKKVQPTTKTSTRVLPKTTKATSSKSPSSLRRTSTSKAKPTSTSSTSSEAPSSTSVDYNSGPGAGLASPVGTEDDADTYDSALLSTINEAILGLGSLVAAESS